VNVSNTKQGVSLVVGMGATGFSIARHLHSRGEAFHVFDTRTAPPMSAQFSECFPESPQHFGDVADGLLSQVNEVCLSPGVSRQEAIVVDALRMGIPVIGDIALFLRCVDKPVIGITGSNGKSTVTTLVGMAAREAGVKVAVGGNIGIPALELLEQDAELYVLELSSFQLESTPNPQLDVACLLNLSPDHMDRYDSVKDYKAAKQCIFKGARHAVFNSDDVQTWPCTPGDMQLHSFGFSASAAVNDRGIEVKRSLLEGDAVMCDGDHVVTKSAIRIKGLHNVANAMAAITITDAIGIARTGIVRALAEFSGLPHRCQWVGEYEGVTFINDSKATNVGACVAALDGLSSEFDGIVLIAGGEGKGADFSALGEVVAEKVGTLVLIGRDADAIARSVSSDIKLITAQDMAEAVSLAAEVATAGELVILSPACASFDMFESFEARGEIFTRCVNEVINASA